ncbi:hypothetical protein [Mycobacterium botniense]|uniref:Uncharacterized protein n=1 Tax=Mycobacterium botniense TaxID=84962 RepID=A0A7I9XUT1_9MYCO|nr:hypothetical protein [Mycobacterium botniense]GFG73260.1 hypothetical protein MBOT_06250 [Mycobacterium botniense]
MTKQEIRLLVVVMCGAAATCLVAGLVTHNRASTPLTLAEVLIPALIPAGLLGYVTVYYRSGTSDGRRSRSTTEGR